ncbi:ADP-ribosylation factor-like protein 6-interacting protein 4 [Phlyctochytrium bullatum]|nr:ADP-ribosylation factor-like protein 6-interacting protein 4 [Phlyctochytrium bullatum]
MDLQSLPLELYQPILNWLPFNSLLHLRLASKRFYDLINHGQHHRIRTFSSLPQMKEGVADIVYRFLASVRDSKNTAWRAAPNKFCCELLVCVHQNGLYGHSQAMALISAQRDLLTGTVNALGKSCITIFSRDLEMAAQIVSKCEPGEVRVLSKETLQDIAADSRGGSPTHTLSYAPISNRASVAEILQSGCSLDFLADGTIGFAPEAISPDDKFWFSEPPHDISASFNPISGLYEICGAERSPVFVTQIRPLHVERLQSLSSEGDMEAAFQDVASYFKMLRRRWADLHLKASECISPPSPVHRLSTTSLAIAIKKKKKRSEIWISENFESQAMMGERSSRTTSGRHSRDVSTDRHKDRHSHSSSRRYRADSVSAASDDDSKPRSHHHHHRSSRPADKGKPKRSRSSRSSSSDSGSDSSDASSDRSVRRSGHRSSRRTHGDSSRSKRTHERSSRRERSSSRSRSGSSSDSSSEDEEERRRRKRKQAASSASSKHSSSNRGKESSSVKKDEPGRRDDNHRRRDDRSRSSSDSSSDSDASSVKKSSSRHKHRPSSSSSSKKVTESRKTDDTRKPEDGRNGHAKVTSSSHSSSRKRRSPSETASDSDSDSSGSSSDSSDGSSDDSRHKRRKKESSSKKHEDRKSSKKASSDKSRKDSSASAAVAKKDDPAPTQPAAGWVEKSDAADPATASPADAKKKKKEKKKKEKKKKEKKEKKEKKKKKAHASGTDVVPGSNIDILNALEANLAAPAGAAAAAAANDVDVGPMEWNPAAQQAGGANAKAAMRKGGRRSTVPQRYEEYQEEMSTLRHVRDPFTGRVRLVKGNGEILEEIVTEEEQKSIRRLATKEDAEAYQNALYNQLGVNPKNLMSFG